MVFGSSPGSQANRNDVWGLQTGLYLRRLLDFSSNDFRSSFPHWSSHESSRNIMKVKQVTLSRKINSLRVNTSENKRQRQKTGWRPLEPKHLVLKWEHRNFNAPLTSSWKNECQAGGVGVMFLRMTILALFCNTNAFRAVYRSCFPGALRNRGPGLGDRKVSKCRRDDWQFCSKWMHYCVSSRR